MKHMKYVGKTYVRAHANQNARVKFVQFKDARAQP